MSLKWRFTCLLSVRARKVAALVTAYLNDTIERSNEYAFLVGTLASIPHNILTNPCGRKWQMVGRFSCKPQYSVWRRTWRMTIFWESKLTSICFSLRRSHRRILSTRSQQRGERPTHNETSENSVTADETSDPSSDSVGVPPILFSFREAS